MSKSVLLIAVVTAILMLMLELSTAVPTIYPHPVMSINEAATKVAYYEAFTEGPALMIRGEFDGLPASISVSLFALSLNHIYPVGYYSGYGSVSINLGNNIVKQVSVKWLGLFHESIWPSLIAFVTYGEENRTWTAVVAVPYNPAWITNNRSVVISVNAILNNGEYALISTRTGYAPTQSSGQAIESLICPGFVEHGAYLYLGSCLGTNQPVKFMCSGKSCLYWVQQACNAYSGIVPFLYVGWSSDAIRNSIVELFVGDVMGYARKGDGLIGVLDVNKLGNYVVVGPTVVLGKDYLFMAVYGVPMGDYIYNEEGLLGSVAVTYRLREITHSGFSGSTLSYVVNKSGFVYVGPYGTVSTVSFRLYDCAESINNTCIKAYITNVWINGTIPLSISPSGFYGSTLYIYSGLDQGNGPITSMFNQLLDQHSTHYELKLLDAYAYPTGKRCLNTPTPALGKYSFTYFMGTPNMFYYNTTDQVVGYFLTESLVEILSMGMLTIPFTEQSFNNGSLAFEVTVPIYGGNNAQLGAMVTIWYVPSSRFYLTFINGPRILSMSAYPSGLIINESGYYLNPPYEYLGLDCQG